MVIKRNKPCPCGSGEKYKKCCGSPQGQKPATSHLNDPTITNGKYLHAFQHSEENIQTSKPGKDISAQSYYNQAISLVNRNMLEEAIALYQKALALQPAAEVYLNLAIIQKRKGKPEDAIASLLKAIELKPDFLAAHLAICRLYQEKKQFERATDSYNQALTINSTDIEALVNLGIISRTRGRIRDAIESFNKALVLDPEDPEIFIFAYSLQKCTPENRDQIKNLEQKFATSQLSEKLRIDLAFALGKAFEELCDYEKAFRYFDEGNRLKRATFKYSTQSFVHEINNIKKHEKFFMSKRYQSGSATQTPIFILGMPRSGTTLVEQILASHSDVYGAGELTEVGDIIMKLTETNDLATIYNNIQQEDREVLNSFASEYINSLQKYSSSAKLITNKLPLNYLFVGLIHLALPNAKIVHCQRDPIDTCWSIFKHLFIGTHKYANNLRELGEYYLLYQDLMEFWHRVFPGMIYDIKYEELVENQDLETRRLLQYCNLAWDERCLTFYKTSRIVETASNVQIRKPIYKDAIQFWRNYEHQLRPLLDVFHSQYKSK